MGPKITTDKYLLAQGYWEASRALLEETRLEVSSWEVPANVDLELILRDFEDYFQFRYDRKPVFAKRKEAVKGGTRISGPAPSKSTGNGRKQSKRASTRHLPQIRPTGVDKENRIDNLQIEGRHMGKAAPKEEKDVLKGLPQEFMVDSELRGLAQQVKRDIVHNAPKVNFGDVVGLETAKQVLTETLRLPRIFPELFESGEPNVGLLEPWKGVLLFGPPGTGKTQLARAFASESGATFFSISASSIISKFHGEYLTRRVRKNCSNPVRVGPASATQRHFFG